MELLKEDGCIGEKAFHGEKECFFQPFYNVEKKRIWGAEALFRLKDENGNYIASDKLIEIAKSYGFDGYIFSKSGGRRMDRRDRQMGVPGSLQKDPGAESLRT